MEQSKERSRNGSLWGTHYFNMKDKYKSFKRELSIVYRNRNICCFCLARGESEIQDTIGDCVRILSGEMRASSVKVFLYVFVRSVPAGLPWHWAALSVSNHSSSDSPPFQKASDKMWARSNRRNDSKSLRRNWCMVRQHRAGADSSLTWGSCKKSWRMDFSTCSKFVLFGRQKVGTSPVQND